MNNDNMITMTPDEFANRFAPAATPTNYFVLNRETGKMELHFEKSAYDALTDSQKQSVKGAFVWGRKSGCWISRCKEPNLYSAKRVAESLGLTDGGKTYRVTPKYRPIPAQSKWMWTMVIGSGCWASDIIYRD